MPVIFFITRTNRYDRYIGDLSYPLYLVHWLVIRVVYGYIHQFHIHQSWIGGSLSIVASVCVAIAMIHVVANPIEIRRKRMAKQIAGT